jgi:hypothetical protein
MKKLFVGNLQSMGVAERDAYVIDARLIQSRSPDPELTIIHPLLVWEYNKPKFKQECIQLGWIDPDLKDHNSSNCLLNAFAIKNHMDKYHIHAYAYDLAALVRQGNMKRKDAQKKLKVDASDAAIKEVQCKLNL